MSTPFNQERSAAIRAALVAEAAGSHRTRPRWWRAVGLLTVGGLAGAGAVTAAFAAGTGAPMSPPAAPPTATATVTSSEGPVPAPPGVVPGSPIISLLGSPVSFVVEREASYDLSRAPNGATHVRVAVSCLTAGKMTFGTGASDINAAIVCDEADPASPHASAWQDLELSKSQGTLYFTTPPGGKSSVSVQYLNLVPTRFGVNANGETYGAGGADQGEPDLVAVHGVDPNGVDLLGYARATDLDAFSPDHPGQPANPAEAVRLQKERDKKYPNGWDFPLYESDGTTKIGTFHVG